MAYRPCLSAEYLTPASSKRSVSIGVDAPFGPEMVNLDGLVRLEVFVLCVSTPYLIRNGGG